MRTFICVFERDMSVWCECQGSVGDVRTDTQTIFLCISEAAFIPPTCTATAVGGPPDIAVRER
jgi:hypothetical protein